jgi:hypothetical protein
MSESDHLVRLWILADKLLIASLQNVVIHKLEEQSMESDCVNLSSLKFVYDNTTPDSKLRRLFLHQCASRISTSIFTQAPYLFPHEMLIELAVLYSKTIRGTDMKNLMPRSDMSLFEVPTDQIEEQSKVSFYSILFRWRLTVL